MSSTETYGMNFDDFKVIFRKRAEMAFDLYKIFLEVAQKKGIPFDRMDCRSVQSFFDEISYAASDEARALMRKDDPDSFLKYDPFGSAMPSLQDLQTSFDELKTMITSKFSD